MSWNKVNVKFREQSLPEVGKNVLWAVITKTNGINKFVGCLTKDGKYVDDGKKLWKITNKFSWMELAESVTSE